MEDQYSKTNNKYNVVLIAQLRNQQIPKPIEEKDNKNHIHLKLEFHV